MTARALRRYCWFFLASALLARFDLGTAAAAKPPPPMRSVALQSELPSGNPDVDTIEVNYYPAQIGALEAGGSATKPQAAAPAIVVLPQLGSSADDPTMRHLGELAASHGINCAVVTLPYHGRRWPVATDGKNHDPALYFLSGDAERATKAFAQSASDVTTVVSWLLTQPDVDKTRIGVVGVSVGAIVAHLAMGRDDRIRAGVAMLGAGNLADISLHSISVKLVRFFHPAQRIPDSLSPDQIERLMHRVDPITYADENRPRRVFMVEAARDLVVPPRDAEALWRALGKPPIRWIDTDHFALTLAEDSAFQASVQYLDAAWALPTDDKTTVIPTPHVTVPTITLGVIGETRAPNSLGITPALSLKLGSLGTYSSHLSVAHADLGLSGRGPFVAAALTVGPFLDVGYVARLGRTTDAPRPYLGVHITF